MKALVTDQGTAAAETGLCNECYQNPYYKKYAREMASLCDDVDPTSDFIDCSENGAVSCCICI